MSQTILAGHRPVSLTVIEGGPAGTHAIAARGGSGGPAAGATLLSVTRLVKATMNRVGSGADVTGEFTITADATISNGGGTDTTGELLLVVWRGAT